MLTTWLSRASLMSPLVTTLWPPVDDSIALFNMYVLQVSTYEIT